MPPMGPTSLYSPTVGWTGFGFTVALMVLSIITGVVCYYSPSRSKTRVRALKAAGILVIGQMGSFFMFAARGLEVLQQQTEVWDGTVVEAGWYDSMAITLSYVSVIWAVSLYMPTDMWLTKVSGKGDSNRDALLTTDTSTENTDIAFGSDSLNAYTNVPTTTSAHTSVTVLAFLLVGLSGAVQQNNVNFLTLFIATGAVGLALWLAGLFMAGFSASNITKTFRKENKNTDAVFVRTIVWGNVFSAGFFIINSIVGMVFLALALGFSPVFATQYVSSSIYYTGVFMVVGLAILTVTTFIQQVMFDVWIRSNGNPALITVDLERNSKKKNNKDR